MCYHTWNSITDFVKDPDIYIVGYQVNFENLEVGKFFFTHSCGATLTYPVEIFSSLYNGPIYEERKTGSDECPGYCLYKAELKVCPAKCKCAYVREVIQIIKDKAIPEGVNA